MSWGTTGWGTGPWGSSIIDILTAVAVSTRVVRVTVSIAPPSNSTTALGDALNPDTWFIERLDTAFFFTVAKIDRLSATVFDVHVLEAFGSSLVTHVVSAMFTSGPASFLGVLDASISTPAALSAFRKFSPTDVANPQTPKGATTPGGTLVITPAGDYATVSGSELVKKLIIRRIFTPRGGFFHLPEYGLGIAIKEPIPTSDLAKLKAEIESQVRLEPEVEDVSIGLLLANDMLTIQVQAKLRATGDILNFNVGPPSSAVSL